MSPFRIVLLGDLFGAGHRDDGLGLAARVASRVRRKLDRPVVLTDLSGPGGIRGILRRLAYMPRPTDVGIFVAGLEDAATDPSLVEWVDAAEGAVAALAACCERTLIVLPPVPVADPFGGARGNRAKVAGRWSTKGARRFAERAPAKLADRPGVPPFPILIDLAPEFRADAAWPNRAGWEHVADQIAAAVYGPVVR